MDKVLRLGFADTYENAILFFENVLGTRYHIERDDKYPDYLIFGDGNFGQSHLRIPAQKKIFFTGENVRPNWLECDHAISFDHENSPRHYRLPLYVLEMWAITKDNNPFGDRPFNYLVEKPIDLEFEWEYKHEKNLPMIAYVQSNPHCSIRTRFVEFINNYHQLDAAGPHMNNNTFVIPRDRELKIQFYHKHAFGMAFENGSYPGYVTEKLIDAYYSNTIPLYWGSNKVQQDFNPRSFLNLNDFRISEQGYDFHAFWNECTNIWDNKNRYLDILGQPAFTDNRLPDVAYIDNFLNWWDNFVI